MTDKFAETLGQCGQTHNSEGTLGYNNNKYKSRLFFYQMGIISEDIWLLKKETQ